jgi:hypothetical protein
LWKWKIAAVEGKGKIVGSQGRLRYERESPGFTVVSKRNGKVVLNIRSLQNLDESFKVESSAYVIT